MSRPRFCVLIQSEELLITEGLHEHQVVPHEVQVQGFLITLFPNHLRIKVGIGIIAAQEMAKRYMNFYVYVLARRPSPSLKQEMLICCSIVTFITNRN